MEFGADRKKMFLREGARNIESGDKLPKPVKSAKTPLIHKMSNGNSLNDPGCWPDSLRGVSEPSGLERFAVPDKGA